MLAGQVLLRRRPVGQCLRLGSQGRCELAAGRSPTHLGFDLFHDRWPTGGSPRCWLPLFQSGRWSLFACWTCLSEPQFDPGQPIARRLFPSDAQLQTRPQLRRDITPSGRGTQGQSQSGSDQLGPTKLIGQNAFDLPSAATGLVLNRNRVPGVDKRDVLVGNFSVALPDLLWRPAFDRLTQGDARRIVSSPPFRRSCVCVPPAPASWRLDVLARSGSCPGVKSSAPDLMSADER